MLNRLHQFGMPICGDLDVILVQKPCMKLIRKLKRDNNPQCSLLEKDMQMFFANQCKVSAEKNERLPLNNVFLQNVRCLQQSQRMTAVGNHAGDNCIGCLHASAVHGH